MKKFLVLGAALCAFIPATQSYAAEKAQAKLLNKTGYGRYLLKVGEGYK